MGIYIEGLKRPEPIKDCTHRNFVDVRIFDDGTATIRTGKSPFFKVYKVKSVPDHGDLIDAHSLKIRLGQRFCLDNRRVMEIVRETVDTAKVVIPAERSER